MQKILTTILIITSYYSISIFSQWEQISNNMYGTDVSCIKNKDSIIYIGTYNSGIFISSDGGLNWENISNGMIDKEIIDLTIADNYIFAAGEHDFQYSSNFGYSWVEIKNPNMSSIGSVCTHKGTIFAGDRNTGTGLWKSVDFGKNWKQSNSCLVKSIYPQDTFYLQIENIYSNGNSLFLGTLDYLYYSSNDGVCWEKIKYDKKYHSVDKVIFTDEEIILLASRTDVMGMKHKLFKAKLKDLIFSEFGEEFFEEYIIDITYDKGKLFTVTKNNVYLSKDHGDTWIKKNKFYDARGINYYDNIIICYDWRDGVYRSTDYGKSFIELTNGLYGLFAGYLNIFDNQIISYTSKGNYISNDLGEYWSRYYITKENGYITSLLQTDNIIFAGTYNSGIYFTSNNGINWEIRNKGLKNLTINKVIKSYDKIFAATGNGNEKSGLYYTTDLGINWIKSDIKSKNNYSVNDIFEFNNTLFIGTHSDGVYKSTDKGFNWIPARKGLDEYFSSITIIFSLNNKIYAVDNSEGLYESSDLGENWYKKLESPKDIVCIAINNDTVYTGTYYHGILISSDYCKTWEKISTNTLLKSTWSLLIKDDYLFAGTNSNGIWRYKINN